MVKTNDAWEKHIALDYGMTISPLMLPFTAQTRRLCWHCDLDHMLHYICLFTYGSTQYRTGLGGH